MANDINASLNSFRDAVASMQRAVSQQASNQPTTNQGTNIPEFPASVALPSKDQQIAQITTQTRTQFDELLSHHAELTPEMLAADKHTLATDMATLAALRNNGLTDTQKVAVSQEINQSVSRAIGDPKASTYGADAKWDADLANGINAAAPWLHPST